MFGDGGSSCSSAPVVAQIAGSQKLLPNGVRLKLWASSSRQKIKLDQMEIQIECVTHLLNDGLVKNLCFRGGHWVNPCKPHEPSMSALSQVATCDASLGRSIPPSSYFLSD